MPRYDFTVFGTATTVKVFRFKEFPTVGVTTSITNGNFDTLYFGGMGYNVAAALGKLGCRVLPALVYSDNRFEEEFKRAKDEFGLQTDGFFMSLGPEYEYSVCYMLEDEHGDNMTFGGVYSGREEPVEYQKVPRRSRQIEDWMVRDSEWVVVTCPVSTKEYEEILDCVERNKSKMVFSMRNDPRIFTRENLWRGVTQAVIVIGNEGEMTYLEEEYGLEKITDLFRVGKAEVIVKTVGRRGSIVYEKTGEGFACHEIPVTDAQRVDIVGAGDAFESGFLYGYLKKMDVVSCAQYGSTLSAFVIEKDGSTTNLPSEDQLAQRTAARADYKKQGI